MKEVILKKNKKGFTLIEIMVAVSIFAMVMVVGIGAVLSIVAANKRAQAYNSVITNLSFALEGMMRDLRTGYNYYCEPTVGVDIGKDRRDCTVSNNVMSPGSSVGFRSSQYGAGVVYGLRTISATRGYIYKQVAGVESQVTSDDVNIDKLQFYVVNTAKPAAGDSIQPRILIIISGKYGGYGPEARFNLQTTVSQRQLDIDET